MRTTKTIIIMIGLLAICTAPTALGADSSWTISAQVRPRFEYRNGYRNLLPPAETDGVVFISQRSRIGVAYSGEAKAKLFVQVQDVRTWGDETHTSTDATADKFDLHQGYVDIIPDETWSLRVGRQEIAYDEDRLLGTGNWNQSGRSHDAVRVVWQSGKTQIHAAWAHHERGEPLSWTPYSNSQNYQDMAYGRIAGAVGGATVNAMLIYDSYDPQFYDASGASIPNRWTGGVYAKSQVAGIRLRGEGYYQTGKREIVQEAGSARRLDIRAFMVGVSASRKFGVVDAVLWYDYLSGGPDSGTDRFESFDPLYGTFHRFYGWADYFIRFPDDTHGLGLQDAAVKFTIEGPRAVTGQADFHYFWHAADLHSSHDSQDERLGFELDVMVTIPLLKTLSLSGGASFVSPTERLMQLKGDSDQGHWVWTMLDFNVK